MGREARIGLGDDILNATPKDSPKSGRIEINT